MSRVLGELLYGRHAHSDPLACVSVGAEDAGRLPAAVPHSVFQLVWHMNYWMDYEQRRIAGAPPRYPEHAALSWPEVAPAAAGAWRQELARFAALLAQLARHADAPAAELARPIPANHGSEAQHAASLEAVLWQTLVHNSYHIGQVVFVRQALGLWPPARGSDTW